MRGSAPPLDTAGSGKVKIYTQDEINAVAHSITPVNSIPLYRHTRTVYPQDGNLGVRAKLNKREMGR